MRVFDPLYGRYFLSENAHVLSQSPEVRRLSQIRLLNTITPTLATLGELRRYAHTLGVLHLYSGWRLSSIRPGFTRTELDALEAAIILHDIATPPFGHLFEYILKEKLGWDHESAASQILFKSHVAENSGHQIFAGRTPRVLRLLSRQKIDREVVRLILTKQHPLHTLIFGSLDFDNIDNVWRMCWALGVQADAQDAIALANAIDILPDGRLLIPSTALPLLHRWASLRREAYEILIWDQPTVSSQAILTAAIGQALDHGLITTDDWTLTDEELLQRLIGNQGTRAPIQEQYLGLLPAPLVSVQLRWTESAPFDCPRAEMQARLQKEIEEAINSSVLVYLFKEKGSFSKKLQYVDLSGKPSTFGEMSRSYIIYVFAARPTPSLSKVAPAIMRCIYDAFECNEQSVLRLFIGGEDVNSKQGLQFGA
jgi:HD superfamily phosphohydrolase